MHNPMNSISLSAWHARDRPRECALCLGHGATGHPPDNPSSSDLRGANTVTTAASAVAGFDQVVCGVTPIYVCNPYETAGMTYGEATQALQYAAANPSDQGRLMRLHQYNGNAPYAAEDYGFLNSPTLGSDEMSLIDSIAVVRPAACFLQRGVNLQPGLMRYCSEPLGLWRHAIRPDQGG
jgi:hypothetical protein